MFTADLMRRSSTAARVCHRCLRRVNSGRLGGDDPAMNIAEWLETARAGDLRPLEARVAQGLDVNLASARGRKALHEAAIAGQRAFIAALVAAGASLEPRDSNQMTPLMSACLRGGDPAEAGSLALLEAGADPNALRADDGLTPLAAAAGAGAGSTALLQALVDRGASVHGSAGAPPLLDAVQYNQRASVRFLLERGADPHARSAGLRADWEGRSVVEIAERERFPLAPLLRETPPR
jgi:ankyrin repeat protein